MTTGRYRFVSGSASESDSRDGARDPFWTCVDLVSLEDIGVGEGGGEGEGRDGRGEAGTGTDNESRACST